MSLTVSNFLNSGLGSSSSLFGTSGGLLGGIDFSQYASVRNGSYYKLLKAHYAANGDSDSTSSSSKSSRNKYNYWNYDEKVKSKTTPQTSLSRDSAATLSAIQTSSSNLKSAAAKLTSTDSGSVLSGSDTTAIYKAVSSYVTEYNNMVKSSAQSNVGVIKATSSSMMNYTASNADLLSSIGITINEKDNTLSIDEDIFKNSDMDKVRELFQGDTSYAAKVSSAASSVGDYARYEASKLDSVGSTGSTSSVSSSNKTYNYWNYNEQVKKTSYNTSTSKDSASTLSAIRTDASSLDKAAEKLMATGSSSVFSGKTATDSKGNVTTAYSTSTIYKAVSSYVAEYNNLIKSSGESKVGAITASRSSMIGYTESNQELLESLGITINSKDNTLSIDENKFKSANMETAKKLFQGKNSYASKVSSAAEAIAENAKYEATKSSTYTNTGNYSSNYASSWNSYS